MGANARQIQKSNTRRNIIKTAYRVFSEKGFSVPTSVIAKEAGVSHGSIFAHFPTLNDLLSCLLSEFGEKMGASLHMLARKCDGIEDFLEKHLDILEEYEAFYTRLISERNKLPDEAQKTIMIIQSTLAYHFGSVIYSEIEKGKVKNLPIHMLLNTWMGLIHYYLLNREFFSPSGESVIKKYKSEMLFAYTNLIKKESGGKA